MDSTTTTRFTFAFLLIVSAVQSTPVQNKNEICPSTFEPVCGKDKSGNLLTFGNECQLRTNSGEYELLEPTKCTQETIESCSTQCPDTSAPICGINKNGKVVTFLNHCHFESKRCSNPTADWTILKTGRCKPIKARKHYHCPNRCSDNHDPICVEDASGKLDIFDNLCKFKKFACNNFKNSWDIVPLHTCLSQKVLDKCSRNCPDVETPVCGVNSNGERTTFKNQCELETTACLNRDLDWKVVTEGACEMKRTTCPNRCTKHYRPVCGQDESGVLRTFPNKCTFDAVQCKERNSNWKLLKQEACAKPIVDLKMAGEVGPECVGICNRDYDPICVMSSSGQMKTFLNKCEFETEKCTNRGGQYKIVKEEEC